MSDKKNTIIDQLRIIGLSPDEATLYLELLEEPTTPFRLAHATGINRTKIYRLITELEKKSLVTKHNDSRGTFFTAVDPSALEVNLAAKKEEIKRQYDVFTELLPSLIAIQKNRSSHFVIHTHEGDAGFKQMLWHELKTKGENLILGGGNMADLVHDRQWIQEYRRQTVKTAYDVREIINPNSSKPIFMLNQNLMQGTYRARIISPDIIPLQNQMTIYNDTVGVYHWHEEEKVGIEIINKAYANMMRSIFEHFWELAEDTNKDVWLPS